MNLNNQIDFFELGTGATLNVESTKHVKVKKIEREEGAFVNFGDDILKS